MKAIVFALRTCLLCLVVLLAATLPAQTPVTMNGASLNKIVSDSSVLTGMPFTYTIFYSLPAGSTGISIIDGVPNPLVVDKVITSSVCGTPTVTQTVNSNGTQIEYKITSTPLACSGSFQIIAHFPAGSTCNATLVKNRACMMGRSPQGFIEVCTAEVGTVAKASDPWSVWKRPTSTTYVGGTCPNVTYSDTVSYEIRVSKNVGIYGYLNLNNAVVTDQLPAGAIVIPGSLTASVGTTAVSGTGLITWNIGNLAAAAPPLVGSGYNVVVLSMKIRYAPLAVGTCVTNSATLKGDLGSQTNSIWCGTHTDVSNTSVRREKISDIGPSAWLVKRVNVAGNTVGCTGSYTIYGYNGGTVPFGTFNFSDVFPTGVTVNAVTVTNVGASATNSVQLYVNGSATPTATYATQTNTYNATPINSIKIVRNGTTNVGQYVLCTVQFTINSSAPNTVTNTVTTTTSFLTPQSAAASFGVYAPAPNACVYKDICSPKAIYTQGDVIRYRLRVQNIGSSTMTGSNLTDVLNANLQYMGGETYYSSAAYNAPCGTPSNWTGVTPAHVGNNLKWNLPPIEANCAAFLYPNCGLTGTSGIPFYFVEFNARIRDTAGLGTILNQFSVQGGNLAGVATTQNVPISLAGTHGFQLEKQDSVVNSAFAVANTTTPNAAIFYRLGMKNTGTAAFRNILMIDKLPMNANTNDLWMLNCAASRNSQFSTMFTNFLSSTPFAPVTTKFDAGSNISLPEFNFACAGATAPTWTGAAPSRNVKLDFGNANALLVGNTLQYVFKGTVDSRATSLQTACNSFVANAKAAYIMNGVNVNQTLLPVESGTACVTIKKCCVPTVVVREAGCVGLPHLFNYERITDTTCRITNIKWDFGDGTSSDIANTTHTYTTIGTFQAILYYVNECGEQKIVFTIKVDKCPCEVQPGFGYESAGLAARFTSYSYSVYPIIGYHWDFGDGTWGNGENTTHTYLKDGIYNVCMVAYADNGAGLCECVGRVCLEVTVKNGIAYKGRTGIKALQKASDPTAKPVEQSSIKIFPNPTHNTLTIQYGNQTPNTLKVFNTIGNLVQTLEPTAEQTVLDMSSFADGVYFINVDDKTFKILKQ
ncbi:MAG: hypothetical protein RLZZ628_3271 [Bacteroidota bacterium]|jgi:uncharacterized repeat protein (TIGR01451 family)